MSNGCGKRRTRVFIYTGQLSSPGQQRRPQARSYDGKDQGRDKILESPAKFSVPSWSINSRTDVSAWRATGGTGKAVKFWANLKFWRHLQKSLVGLMSLWASRTLPPGRRSATEGRRRWRGSGARVAPEWPLRLASGPTDELTAGLRSRLAAPHCPPHCITSAGWCSSCRWCGTSTDGGAQVHLTSLSLALHFVIVVRPQWVYTLLTSCPRIHSATIVNVPTCLSSGMHRSSQLHPHLRQLHHNQHHSGP